jgi:hypothetical protein
VEIATTHVQHHFLLGSGTGRLGHVTFYVGIACIAIGLAALVVRRRSWLVTAAAAAAGSAVVASGVWRSASIYRYSDARYLSVRRPGGVSHQVLFHTGVFEHVGTGIWITIAGGAVIVAAAFVGSRPGSSVVAVADR